MFMDRKNQDDHWLAAERAKLVANGLQLAAVALVTIVFVVPAFNPDISVTYWDMLRTGILAGLLELSALIVIGCARR
jgi:hypothetical protein